MKKLKTIRKTAVKVLTIGLCVTFLLFGFVRKSSRPPVNIIFDSDIGPDYDDVGAIAILHAFADRGDAKILATIASNKYNGIAAIINIFNTYFHRPGIPIGVPKGKAMDIPDSQHWSDTLLARYPHNIYDNEEVPDAVEVYRKILSQQPNHSVTIVTVGFLTNLDNLLRSKADKYSSLNGRELVKEKVKKLVSMAGSFPSGKEFNLDNDIKASKSVFESWPTSIIFSGFEIGAKIRTGLPIIRNAGIKHSPVKDVFNISIPLNLEDSLGRMSWDESAVLTAVCGNEPFFKLHPGRIKINDDGSDSWDDKGKGQFYLELKEDPDRIADVINHLMMHQPL